MVVLCGILAVEAERLRPHGGIRSIRYLVVVRTTVPQRRIDVIPVALHNPPPALWRDPGDRDDPIWVVGAVQRLLADSPDGNPGRLEVVAEQVVVGDLGERRPVAV